MLDTEQNENEAAGGRSDSTDVLGCARMCEDFCNVIETANAEIARLLRVATRSHDMLLRGEDDDAILEVLQTAWRGPNAQ